MHTLAIHIQQYNSFEGIFHIGANFKFIDHQNDWNAFAIMEIVF